jgi:hypothetical protein
MTGKPIHEALHDVMADVTAVPKTDRNQQQNFDFRGIDAIINAVGPALRTHHVIAYPHTVDARYRDVTTTTGKPSRECVVLVTYRFLGPGGDYLDIQVPGESLDAGDKGTAKAMSVAYRIALIQALCLPTGDRDPDHDTYERGKPDPAEALRDQIRAVADERKLPHDAVAADFKARTKLDLKYTRELTVMQHYLGRLRTHGVVNEVPV